MRPPRLAAALATLALVAALAPVVGRVAAQQADMVALARRFDAAYRAGDGEALAALLADDFAVQVPDGSGETLRDTGALLAAQEDDLARGTRVESDHYVAAGNRVAWQYRRSDSASRQFGVGPVEGTAEATLHNGRIVSLVLRESPEAVRRHDAAVAAALATAAAACGGHPGCRDAAPAGTPRLDRVARVARLSQERWGAHAVGVGVGSVLLSLLVVAGWAMVKRPGG